MTNQFINITGTRIRLDDIAIYGPSNGIECSIQLKDGSTLGFRQAELNDWLDRHFNVSNFVLNPQKALTDAEYFAGQTEPRDPLAHYTELLRQSEAEKVRRMARTWLSKKKAVN